MANDQWGSKLRCSLLALCDKESITRFFNELINGYGKVDQNDFLQPSLEKISETTLSHLSEFLSCKEDNFEDAALKEWWVGEGQGLPHWDFVSSFTSANRQEGLILVEAKDHEDEFERKGADNPNHLCIRMAIEEAKLCLTAAKILNSSDYKNDNAKKILEGIQKKQSFINLLKKAYKSTKKKLPAKEKLFAKIMEENKDLNLAFTKHIENLLKLSETIEQQEKEEILKKLFEEEEKMVKVQFNLSTLEFYQLSNRFAFAWKLASMGIPTILIYLGFIGAEEMGKRHFKSHNDWKKCVEKGSEGIIPSEVWKTKTFYVNGNKNTGTPLTFLIKSAKVTTQTKIEICG